MPHFRLAHVSDPHLPPPDVPLGWRDVASKRLLSRIAWRRKRRRHRAEVLAALVADVRAQAPDHVALTGDLTNFATAEEFAAARTWLESIGPAEAVTVSPGNHDALVRSRGDDPFAAWRDWLGDDAAQAFPKVRVRGDVALINLCSAVPTALHLAQGRLGEAQIARLAEVLREEGEAGRFRLVLVHHPIAQGAVSGRKALTDAAALRAVLAREGAELVLHGHAHEALVTRVAGPAGAIPVLGVPSASAAADGHGEAARWHGLEIARAGDAFEIGVTARGLTPEGGFGELGRYRLTSPGRR